jgi:recombination protein RecT
MTDKNTQVAVSKKETIDIVTARIKQFQEKGELYSPPNYSPENALKSAWLMVQETVDKDGKPALDVCSQASVANSLLSMVVQGLNPDKKQCYFIVRGKKLYAQRSYFGSIHVAKMVDPNIVDVYAKTVYEDDEFEYEIKHGKEIVTLHKQKLSNIKKDKIAAAYATILYADGRELSTVMTIEQIKQAWKQSPMHPVDEKGNIKAGSTHDKFTADMCEKTATNKACKYVINTSDDKSIVAKYAKMMDAELAEAEVEAEIDENANKEMIDITDASYTVGDAEEEAEKPEENVKNIPTENPPKQDKKQQKEAPDSLLDMAEEGPGY